MCGVASNCLQEGDRLTPGGRHAPGYPTLCYSWCGVGEPAVMHLQNTAAEVKGLAAGSLVATEPRRSFFVLL